MKAIEREQAVSLRKQGQTYTEISRKVPVSRATLSLWLRDTPVPASYKNKLLKLKQKAVEKGWQARRRERIERTEGIVRSAKEDFLIYKDTPLWLVGLTLYWAEGSKEKKWGKCEPVSLINMDSRVLQTFQGWCTKTLGIEPSDLCYDLYIHETRKRESTSMAYWWAKKLRIKASLIRTYYKKSKASHIRRNDGKEYRGIMRIRVKRSTDLNRKISAWIDCLANSLI